MKYITRLAMVLFLALVFYALLNPSLEQIVEKSAISFDQKVLRELYKTYPEKKLEIDSTIFKFWGARIDSLNYEELQPLYLNNKLSILDEKIQDRRLYLISNVYKELNNLDFSEFYNFTLQNPEKTNLVNTFIENSVFANKEKYTYDDLYFLNQALVAGSDFKAEFETELYLREESILNSIEDLSFTDLNKYYNSNKGNLIAINNFIKVFVLPTIDEYNYFELKQIAPLLSFSSVIDDIEKIKNDKRSAIISTVTNEFQNKINDENTSYLAYKKELKVSVDNYFFPAFEKFCDEYFDIGSDIYRFFAAGIDLVSDGDFVGDDFKDDWEKFINVPSIHKNARNRAGILQYYVETSRKKTIEDLAFLIDTPIALNIYSTINKFGQVNFYEGRIISKSLANKNALVGLGSTVIEGGAAFFTAGTSLIATRGASMVGSASLSMMNDDSAKGKFVKMYESSMAIFFDNNDRLYVDNQNIFYNNLLIRLNENL